MTRTLRLWTAILLTGLLVLGCGGSDDDDGGTAGPTGGHPPAEMVDSWEYSSVRVNGTPASLATVMDWVADAVSARAHVLRSDGTYLYEEVNAGGGQLYADTGFVFIDGDEMDINFLADNGIDIEETIRVGWTLVGDVLTWTQTEGSDTFVFTLTRME